MIALQSTFAGVLEPKLGSAWRWCRSSVSPDAVAAVYGLRPLVATAVSSGASVPPYAVVISSLLVYTSIKTVGLHL